MAIGEPNGDPGLIYEVDESGTPQLVRSLESTEHVYVRFTNTTSRPLKVSWRDFSGRQRFYAFLKPTEFCDINTYVTHPWEFTDVATGERFNVGEHVIFRAPSRRGEDARYRQNWNISVSLRSLRDTALLQVALMVPTIEQVASLGLPRELTEDVKILIQVIQESERHRRNN